MLRIMTHNVWEMDENSPAWQEKGLNCSAQVRVLGHLQVYKDTLPDVIGYQEMSSLMQKLLIENTSYEFINGDYTPISYRADKLELIDSYFEIYPDGIDDYEGIFNDSKSKSYTIAVFREKKSGRIFAFANTHLWWKTSDITQKGTHAYQEYSDEARVFQMSKLIKKAEEFREKYNCFIIVAGDFNTDYNSHVLKLLFENGYKHAHDIATDNVDDTVGYHYCFPDGYEEFYYDKPFCCAIDHILVKGESECAVKNFNRYSPEYYLPISDHSPAYFDIEL